MVMWMRMMVAITSEKKGSYISGWYKVGRVLLICAHVPPKKVVRGSPVFFSKRIGTGCFSSHSFRGRVVPPMGAVQATSTLRVHHEYNLRV